MIIIQLLTFLVGFVIVVITIMSAIRTLVLPRSARDNLARFVFVVIRQFFKLRLWFTSSYDRRDSIMALYAPLSLLVLLVTWLVCVTIGFAAMFWATGIESWVESFTLSGSSLLTLGYATGKTPFQTFLSFSEATIGLILIALLIAYLPTIYNAFSRRESAVKLLEVRAGAPPSPIEMLIRYERIRWLQNMDSFWEEWERWFAELEESHTSLAALVFFRSPRADQSWITAAGAVLDGAALLLSTLDVPWNPQAALCIRAGYLTLREIAAFFGIPSHPEPTYPEQSISITREEFDAACEELAAAGVALKSDRDQAWQDFAGWRVNYDDVLLALCALTMAPEALWSSDRAPDSWPLPLFRR